MAKKRELLQIMHEKVSKRMVKRPNPIDVPDELFPDMPNDGDDF